MKNGKNKMKRSVFLVTGGSSPIGQAITRQIVRESGAVAIHYQHSKRRAVEFCRELEKKGAEVFPFSADLNRPQDAPILIRKVISHWGRLDYLINNAALFKPTPLGRSGSADWEKMFRVNALSPYFLAAATLPWLRRSRGAVIHVTDIYGSHPVLKDHGAYCVSKAALVALTCFMAKELGPDVRVNAVSPGAITFPKTYTKERRTKVLKRSALNRMGSPEDIASAVMFLTKQRFITGQVLNVDGGRFSG
jgi:pteridine reductase